jgi:SGNH domain-containing protein
MLSRCLRSALLACVLGVAFTSSAAGGTCFGAAARDQPHGCISAKRQSPVVPTPSEARTLPNSPCVAIRRQTTPPVCSFGTPAESATATVALVGDSHAGHWRGALTHVALAKGWRGLSITHTSCPLQIAVRDLPEPRRSQCAEWKRQVFAWFAVHPEVQTVFVAGLTGGSGVMPAGGKSRFATSVDGYADAWNALPATVRHIVVIRDTPKFPPGAAGCIERAISAQTAAGPTCARRRSDAIDADPAILAASRMPSTRVQTVDLTRFFCDRSRCYPVIGGGLVLRDNTHMTGVFSATLGPYLLAAFDQIAPRFA